MIENFFQLFRFFPYKNFLKKDIDLNLVGNGRGDHYAHSDIGFVGVRSIVMEKKMIFWSKNFIMENPYFFYTSAHITYI